MRLDRYLFFARLAKSRTQAQQAIAEGYVWLDGRRCLKTADEVRPGSLIALSRGGQIRIFKVASLPLRRGPPAEARACYEEVPEAASM